MKTYALGQLYSLYVLEYKKDKPLFEPVSVMEFFNWLQKRETEGRANEIDCCDANWLGEHTIECTASSEESSPFDSTMDAQADYSEEGR